MGKNINLADALDLVGEELEAPKKLKKVMVGKVFQLHINKVIPGETYEYNTSVKAPWGGWSWYYSGSKGDFFSVTHREQHPSGDDAKLLDIRVRGARPCKGVGVTGECCGNTSAWNYYTIRENNRLLVKGGDGYCGYCAKWWNEKEIDRLIKLLNLIIIVPEGMKQYPKSEWKEIQKWISFIRNNCDTWEKAKQYKGLTYRDINSKLRFGRKSTRAEALKLCMQSCKTRTEQITFRGMGVYNTLQEGQVYKDLGFFSTSYNINTARNFLQKTWKIGDRTGYMCYVKIPKGVNYAPIDAYYDACREWEVVLPPGTHFKVTKLDPFNREVTLEVVPPPSQDQVVETLLYDVSYAISNPIKRVFSDTSIDENTNPDGDYTPQIKWVWEEGQYHKYVWMYNDYKNWMEWVKALPKYSQNKTIEDSSLVGPELDFTEVEYEAAVKKLADFAVNI